MKIMDNQEIKYYKFKGTASSAGTHAFGDDGNAKGDSLLLGTSIVELGSKLQAG